MKSHNEISRIMEAIPPNCQKRWCGAEGGTCACMGCVQIGNRVIMYEDVAGDKFQGDPEHINETKIPDDVFKKYKITKEEWEWWLTTQKT